MAREYSLKMTRNIGIMAHIDAGKTTTTERILYHTGKVHKIGETHDGESQMDWMAQEQERGITITSAATTAVWNDHRVNIIDTPGHVDFTIEVERSLKVLDGAVAVLDAQAGVEPQTETVWRQATTYRVPRIVFVNKMDKIGANFEYSLGTIGARLNAKAAAVQWPIGAEDAFEGFIDLIEMKEVLFDGAADEEYKTVDIRADLKDIAEAKRQELIEAVADFDEDLMMKVLEGEQPSNDELIATIRKATISVDFFPVLCGTAFKNKGVKPLLDNVIKYLPSPLDVPAMTGVEPGTENTLERPADDSAPFSALAFKIMTDPFVGKLTFFRVYSGTVNQGDSVLNSTKDKKERMGRLLQMHANKREEIKIVYAGDIAAAIGLKDTTTGDTLCDPKHEVILETMNFPEPVISLALEPKSKGDSTKMSDGLIKLAEEDPSFRTFTDEETGQTIIAGMGELHLDIIVDRLKREFNVEANVGEPQVSFRETLTSEGEAEGKYIKQSGGKGQYGHCKIKFIPNPGEGFEFEDKIVGGKIPKEYINSVKVGLEDALKNGLVAGFPVIDVKAELYDGSYHDVDSSESAYKIAASMCLKNSVNVTKPVLLEPIMKVEVVAPEEYFGTVMGDLSSRRGMIQGDEQRGNAKVVTAHVPLKEMFGYSTILRSNTQGRGTYTMVFDHYNPAPKSITEEIMKNR